MYLFFTTVLFTGSCIAANYTDCCNDGVCVGEPSNGNCFCDVSCLQFGDCCSDFLDICPQPGTCADANYDTCCDDGVCLGSDGVCFCDAFCRFLEDCCMDIDDICLDISMFFCHHNPQLTQDVLLVNKIISVFDILSRFSAWHLL